MELTLLIITALLSAGCFLLLLALLLRRRPEGSADGRALEESLRRLEEKTDTVGKLSDFNARTIDSLNRMTETRLNAIQGRLAEDIKYIVETNAQNLDRIRRTVDDKLTSSLDGRLSDSYARISERLEHMYKSVGEMKSLADGIADIKRVFTNVKLRGTWGETQLQALLEQMLAPEQYRAGVRLNPLDNLQKVKKGGSRGGEALTDIQEILYNIYYHLPLKTTRHEEVNDSSHVSLPDGSDHKRTNA